MTANINVFSVFAETLNRQLLTSGRTLDNHVYKLKLDGFLLLYKN